MSRARKITWRSLCAGVACVVLLARGASGQQANPATAPQAGSTPAVLDFFQANTPEIFFSNGDGTYVAVGDATTAAQALASVYSAAPVGTHWIGAEVVPADDTLRSQIGLPDGQGLVVSWIHRGSPAAEAGLESHDVILQFAGKSLASVDDLTKQVDLIGETPSGLLVMRQGKRMTLQLKPQPAAQVHARYRVVADQSPPRIWIGVELGGVDETLRAQLKLAPDEGVLVTNVIGDTPAARSGIKKHDVLISLRDRTIASEDSLRQMLQEEGEKAVPLKLVREGKSIAIQITPETHQDAVPMQVLDLNAANWKPLRFDVLRPAAIAGRLEFKAPYEWIAATNANVAPQPDLQNRVQELVEQLKTLQQKLESINDDLKRQAGSTPQSSEPSKK